jgi:hypothetical protein
MGRPRHERSIAFGETESMYALIDSRAVPLPCGCLVSAPSYYLDAVVGC